MACSLGVGDLSSPSASSASRVERGAPWETLGPEAPVPHPHPTSQRRVPPWALPFLSLPCSRLDSLGRANLACDWYLGFSLRSWFFCPSRSTDRGREGIWAGGIQGEQRAGQGVGPVGAPPLAEASFTLVGFLSRQHGGRI